MIKRRLVYEAFVSLMAKPLRTTLTILSAAAGVAALVATVGVSTSAANAILDDIQQASGDFFEISENASALTDVASGELSLNSYLSMQSIPGVVNYGETATVANEDQTLSRFHSSVDATSIKAPVLVAVGDVPEATGATVDGRWFTSLELMSDTRAVVLGEYLAQQMAIAKPEEQIIFLADRPFTVIGILKGGDYARDLLSAALLPVPGAQSVGNVEGYRILVRTAKGAAEQVARSAIVAISPDRYSALTVGLSGSLGELPDQTEEQLDSMYLVLLLVGLLSGGLAIMSITAMSVHERRSEFGLRLALGATSRQIVLQVVVECLLLGGLGGVIGCAIGIVSTIFASSLQGWAPAIGLPVLLAAVATGIGIAAIAGAWPAFSAGRTEPSSALRNGEGA